jgi:hypothetical protein
MWSAESLDQILKRAAMATHEQNDPDGSGERVVSMVFAPPKAALWEDIDFPYVNDLADRDWDLFFVGAPGVARGDQGVPREGVSMWSVPEHMDWKAFRRIARDVHRHHAVALRDRDGAAAEPAWRFAGKPELVSFIAYWGVPDWLSLRAVNIEQYEIGEITARMVPGEDGHVDPQLAPGLGQQAPVVTKTGLQQALLTTVRQLPVWAASGVVGNAASGMIGF